MIAKTTSFTSYGGLSVVQIATSDQDSFQYMHADAAIEQKLLVVKEVSESGSVNTLAVMNLSESFVFMMDGDVLAGAKQNRVVNTSILLAPQSKTVIPVSCVESGRWRFVSSDFSSVRYSVPLTLRSGKAGQVHESLRAKRGHMADQGEIWNQVDQYQSSSKILSATSNLGDVFMGREKDLDSFTTRFLPDPDSNGFAVFYGKEIVSIDIFNRRDVYAHVFGKMMRGSALEMLVRTGRAADLQEAEARYRAVELIDRAVEAPAETFPGAGIGVERRFQLPDHRGFVLGYEGFAIHMAVLKAHGVRPE